MNRPTQAEAFIAPELALLPALIAMLDASLALLRAQHPALERDPQRGDPQPLCLARALAVEIERTRVALHRYARAARSVVRAAVIDDGDLPF